MPKFNTGSGSGMEMDLSNDTFTPLPASARSGTEIDLANDASEPGFARQKRPGFARKSMVGLTAEARATLVARVRPGFARKTMVGLTVEARATLVESVKPSTKKKGYYYLKEGEPDLDHTWSTEVKRAWNIKKSPSVRIKVADGSRDLRVQRRVVRYVHERPHPAVERSSEEHVGGTGSGTGCQGVVIIGQELDTMAQQYVDEYSKREPAEYEVSEPSEVTGTLGQLYAGAIFSDGSMVVYLPCLGEATTYRDLELEALGECTPMVTYIAYATTEPELTTRARDTVNTVE